MVPYLPLRFMVFAEDRSPTKPEKKSLSYANKSFEISKYIFKMTSEFSYCTGTNANAKLFENRNDKILHKKSREISKQSTLTDAAV